MASMLPVTSGSLPTAVRPARGTPLAAPQGRSGSLRSRDDWTALGNPCHGRNRPRFRERPAHRRTRPDRGRLALAPSRATAFAAEFGIPRVHGSYEALVSDPDVDIVYVVDAASDARRERDPRARARQARARREAVHAHRRRGRRRARRRRPSGVCSRWRRCGRATCRTWSASASSSPRGALGDIRAVLADHTQKISTDPAHRLNALELGGGALLDLGIYPISFAWDILGEPRPRSRRPPRIGATGVDGEVATIFTHAIGRALDVALGIPRRRPQHRAHHRHRRPDRHRPGLVHPDHRSGWSRRTGRCSRRTSRTSRAAACSTRRSPPSDTSQRARTTATSCRSTRRSRSWERSTRCARQIGSATPARTEHGRACHTGGMPDSQNSRVAVYLDFDNIVISWYDRVHGAQLVRRATGSASSRRPKTPRSPSG